MCSIIAQDTQIGAGLKLTSSWGVRIGCAGDSGGGLYLWEPFRIPLGSADREIAPRLAWTGHAGEVWAACLTPGAEDPQATAPKVFTAGVAKTAAVCHALHGWQAVPGHRAE